MLTAGDAVAVRELVTVLVAEELDVPVFEEVEVRETVVELVEVRDDVEVGDDCSEGLVVLLTNAELVGSREGYDVLVAVDVFVDVRVVVAVNVGINPTSVINLPLYPKGVKSPDVNSIVDNSSGGFWDTLSVANNIVIRENNFILLVIRFLEPIFTREINI